MRSADERAEFWSERFVLRQFADRVGVVFRNAVDHKRVQLVEEERAVFGNDPAALHAGLDEAIREIRPAGLQVGH